MSAQRSLIAELENAIKGGTPERRVETLRRVTDLFMGDAGRYSELQVGLFDDVLCRLIQGIETQALSELSSRLAPVDNAPIEAIRRLARDDEIAVAGPVLRQATRLTSGDLVEIAGSKSQGHLLAISTRRSVDETVTDVLLERGEREVRHSLAKNNGARFSERGFVKLVKSAQTDESLAEKVGLRPDLPTPLRADLLRQATDVVRSRLLANAPPGARHHIQQLLARIARDVGQGLEAPRDFGKAMRAVSRMQEQGILDESALLSFVTAKSFEGLVVALSALSTAPVDLVSSIMQNVRVDGLLIVCKAAGLQWASVDAIRHSGLMGRDISNAEFDEAKGEYQGLSQDTAQRALRFWKVRTTAVKQAPGAHA
jgi:uncharacterized protein (DUF2336 family)